MPNTFEGERDRLRQALDELVALNQIAKAINALMSIEQITQVIVDHCLRRIQATQGAVFLLDEEAKQIDKFRTFVREFSQSKEKIPFHLDERLSGWMIKNKTILVSNNADSDERFRGMDLSTSGIHSILSAPLLSRRGLIGSLVMFNKKDFGGFTDNDKRFLGIVGAQTSKVIENAQLHEQEKKLIAIQEEIKVARSIQKGFLPSSGIRLSACEVYGFNFPAKEIGGDFYDIVKLEDGKVFLSLGDVSGKGIPAALLMANAQAVLRSQLFKAEEKGLLDLADSLNHLICQFSGPEQYITAVFGQYDCSSGRFHYINAGHLPPLVVKKKEPINKLTKSDLVIGVMPGYRYMMNEVVLESDDILFLYSDGITELFGENDEEFGEERLEELLLQHRKEDISTIGTRILKALTDFREGKAQSDDITMVLLKVH